MCRAPKTGFAKRTLGAAVDMTVEGGRILSSGLGRKLLGHRTYEGGAKEICREIVARCFHPQKRYFRTSLTTYQSFWARDFGRCVPALIDLGYREEVLSSYRWALEIYERQQRFALVITPGGTLFDFPYYAPDGFAFFLSGLTHLNAPQLIETHRAFLEQELMRFTNLVVDKDTGLVRDDRFFSEAQDFTKRRSSCYSNAMCHVVKQAAHALDLENSLWRFDYEALIRKHFFAGDHFFDDMTRLSHVSGDACVTPFYVNAVENPERIFPIVLSRMDEEGLTHPFLARYGNTAKKNRPMIRLERFNQWQRDTVWSCLGLQLLEVLQRLAPDRYLTELAKYEALVERLRCFPEVLSSDSGTLFKGPFYMSDDSMLWAADLLRMLYHRDGELPK
jgi:hypothetical protein